MDTESEENVKRIVGEEIKKSQNKLLSSLDTLFKSRLQDFGKKQEEKSEAQMSRLHMRLPVQHGRN